MNEEIIEANLNTIFYVKKSGSFIVPIPHKNISQDLQEMLIKQETDLEEEKERLKAEKLKRNEKRNRLKVFRIKHKHKKVFGFFIKLNNELNIVSFKEGNKKSELSKEDVKAEMTNDTLNALASYLDKSIHLTKYQPKSIVIQKDLDDLRKDYNEAIILLDYLNNLFKNNKDYILNDDDIFQEFRDNMDKFDQIDKKVKENV